MSEGRTMVALWWLVLALWTPLAMSGEADNAKDTANRSASVVPKANAAWVYDISNKPGEARRYDPGYFATALNNFNRSAERGHKIQLVYTYSGSLEMYCPGRKAELCRLDDLIAVYPLSSDKKLRGSDATHTVQAYASEVDGTLAEGRVMVVPVIDGVVSGDYEGSMKGFNELRPEMARAFADKVARKVCEDRNVAGVQFDIEPFNVSKKNGQYHFYRRIAENFAGEVPASLQHGPVKCKNEDFPQGRFFSVFASSNQLNPAGPAFANIREIITEFNNGYMIAPLYDLGSGPAGHALAVTEYQRRATRHAKQMAKWAAKGGVPFQLGIPAAATVHEHAYCRGGECRKAPGAATDMPTQDNYLEASLHAIEDSGARDVAEFRGVAVWGWTRGVTVHGLEFEPQVPPWNALKLLGTRL